MEFAACVVPAAPVRKKASHKCEMVNQLLFGETMQVLKVKKEQWLKIRSLHDKYEGWVRKNLLEPINEKTAKEYNAWVTADILNIISIKEMKMHLPVGASMSGYENGEGKFGNFKYQYAGNYYQRNKIIPSADIINQLTGMWLNAPYMWGGRTPFGVDCSGFVQVVFKMMGIDLWRDAYLQIKQGIKIRTLQDAQCGDLAFFEKKNRITHVGILLDKQRIIHSSGKVRIDNIDTKGIVNSSTRIRMHTLKAIRRYW